MGDTNPLTGVSGPGKFAVREDLPPSQNYGDRKVMQEDIAGASTRPNPDVSSAAKPEPMVGLFASTQRKNEPITSGIPLGAGPGPEAMGMQDATQMQYTDAYQLFNQLASNPNASPSMKYLAQRIQQGF